MKFKKRVYPSKFECEICLLIFNKREDFDSHNYFHENPPIYSCYLCQKSFAFKRGLGRHYQKNHFEVLNKRISARKHRKWLRSYLRTSVTEDDLSLGEMDESNIDYVESLKSFRQTRLKQEAEWLAREYLSDDRLVVEDFYLASSDLSNYLS
jgi:hypothetical protein